MVDDTKPLSGSDTNTSDSSESSPNKDNKGETNSAPAMHEKTAPIKPKKSADGKKWWHIFSYKHTHLATWQWALLVLSMLLLIVISAFGAYKLYQRVRKLPPQPAVVIKKAPPKPKLEPSRLTGLPVDPELNKRPVTGVMIENSPDARPQAGLKDAGIVFEAIAEGGITRFLALSEDTKSDYIGPVRSARPYYLDWVLAFDASLAHAGGSPDALAQINALHVRDLDEFANSAAYRRVNTRFAPHNLYTSTNDLDTLNQKKGFNSSNFTSWPRKVEKRVNPATAGIIDFNVSGFLYSPHYNYEPSLGIYLRSEGGQPHKDERSGVQLAPKVVIAMVTGYSIAGDGVHSVYNTIGSGHMYVFQDGSVTEGTWQKSDHNAQFKFTNSAGAELKLNPGQTWVTMVSSNSAVTYKP